MTGKGAGVISWGFAWEKQNCDQNKDTYLASTYTYTYNQSEKR